MAGVLESNASGTWDDDPKNWERAFQSKKPDDVRIVHSRYWRSAHWTYEFQYFFEIAQNDALQKQLFSKNDFVRLEGQAAVAAKQKFFGDCPLWFAPKSIDKYTVWIYRNSAASHFRIFIDQETGNLFLTDYSV